MNKSQLLYDLEFGLKLKRPHGGTGVTLYCDYISTVVKTLGYDCTVDYAGNLHVDLRLSNHNSTLFVAHVDTVHREDGNNPITIINKQYKSINKTPLGADDGAGVALLLHLIRSEVPAYYIFTQGEEVGGIGSSWLAENKSQLLAQFNRAIAFDRKDNYSIITHQARGRCASDTFGNALADKLNMLESNFLYVTDDGGIYTDTAEFTKIIPECTNISVGYKMEHTEHESLDIRHFLMLANAIVQVDWDSLPTRRDPLIIESKEYRSVVNNYNNYHLIPSAQELIEDDIDDLYIAIADAIDGNAGGLMQYLYDYTSELGFNGMRYINSKDIKRDTLEEAEKMLETGFSPREVCDFILEKVYVN